MEKEFYKLIKEGVRRSKDMCYEACNFVFEDTYDNITFCNLFCKDLKFAGEYNESPFYCTKVYCCQECNKYFGVKDVNS